MLRGCLHNRGRRCSSSFVALLGILFLLVACAPRKPRKAISEKNSITQKSIPKEAPTPQELFAPLDYSTAPEIRGVWLTTIYGLDWPQAPASSTYEMKKQREELCRILDRLALANFNTVFLQVRLRGDLLYPSSMEPMSGVLTRRDGVLNYDPLAFAVEECHKRGLTLHAWIVTFPLGTDKHVRSLGNKGIWGRNRSWCIAHKGEWYLDPGNPEVHQYITDLSLDLVRRYDVDGIHFDYIRYPEHVASFKDQSSYAKYGKGEDKSSWRRKNISTLLRKVSESVRKAQPHVLISAATLGKFRTLTTYPKIGWTCRESVYQDPLQWHKEGSIDFIVPMMYYKDHHFDPFLYDWKTQIPALPIVPGLGAYRVEDNSRWHSSVIAQQIKMTRQQRMAGVCFYREENIRPQRKGLDRVIAQYFTEPVRMYPFNNRLQSKPDPPYNLQIKRFNEREVAIFWEEREDWKGRSVYNLFVHTKGSKQKRGEDLLLVPLIYGTQVQIASELLENVEFIRVEAMNRAFQVGGVSHPLYLKDFS